MNLYLLVEGKVTEMVIYSRWIPYLLPGMRKVDRLSDVRHNNFYMFSGYGYPSIIHRMANSISDINRHGNIDYLIVCLDAEEDTIDHRYRTVMERLDNLNYKLTERTKVKVIVHNHCIETWFLGNREMELYPSEVNSRKLRRMITDYNVFHDDPEEMPANPEIEECSTIAQYHYSYLKHLFNEHHLPYTKRNPGRTSNRNYLRALIDRYDDTGDIKSFGFFIKFCNQLRNEMKREARDKKRRERISGKN